MCRGISHFQHKRYVRVAYSHERRQIYYWKLPRQRFTGKLKPKGGSVELDFAMAPKTCFELSKHTMYTEAIQRFVEQEEDESNRVMYISAIKDLLEIICEVYRKVSAGKTGLHLMHLLIGWLYRQPEEFVSIMEQQEPHALIIAPSWGVLLKYTESSWLPADV